MKEILKPRYQYHGLGGGANIDMHLYGLGLFTTSYSQSDRIIEHEVVRGHIGDDRGLIAGVHFWKDYTFSYIINGALYGYTQDPESFYEKERQTIYNSVDTFIKKLE